MRETAGPRRYVEEKIKENENAKRGGGGEDEGVINIELSCTEIFSAFALAATLWLMVSSLKNAVFKIKAKPCNAELFIFRWFCESIFGEVTPYKFIYHQHIPFFKYLGHS